MRVPLAVFAALSCLPINVCASGGDASGDPSPDDLAISRDGRRLYVVCTATDEVIAVDTAQRSVAARARVGRVPRGIALGAGRVYVTNSWSDSVSELDAQTLRTVRQLPTGVEPTGVALDERRGILYVANRLSDDVSVVNLSAGSETRRVPAGRGASYVAIDSAGSRVYVTHIYPALAQTRAEPQSEITVIDARSQTVESRLPLPNAAGVFHAALSADGRLGITGELRPKNLLPLAQVEHGSAMGNSLAVFGADVGAPVQLPLDGIDEYFSLPFGVAISPDKRFAYVSASGSNQVAIVDLRRLTMAAKSPAAPGLADDLTASARYVLARIPVGRNPRQVVLSPDGLTLYVANRLDDSISVIDVKRQAVSGVIGLGGSDPTPARRGERVFYSSEYTPGRQFGCASCHLDSTFDGISWDLGHDRFGSEIVDTKALEQIGETAPFKWNGTTPNLETECGPITERFIFRSQGPRGKDLDDLVAYVNSIPLRPNRYRLPEGRLTAAQTRGKAIFDRTAMKDGTPLLPVLRCTTCHYGPDLTSREVASVGTLGPDGRALMLDTPQLTNIAYSAPYLHDGSARTLQEVFSRFNPKNLHGVTGDLTKEELDDLVEYLKTL